jgi:hypothetical protein
MQQPTGSQELLGQSVGAYLDVRQSYRDAQHQIFRNVVRILFTGMDESLPIPVGFQ